MSINDNYQLASPHATSFSIRHKISNRIFLRVIWEKSTQDFKKIFEFNPTLAGEGDFNYFFFLNKYHVITQTM